MGEPAFSGLKAITSYGVEREGLRGERKKKKKKRAIEREELALTIVPTFNESITQKVNYTQSLSLLKGRHLIQ